MKKELREIIEPKIQILSERKNKAGDTTMRIVAPWMVAGRKNKNGRLYSLPLIQREVAKFQDRVKQGSAIGSADHPFGAHTTLADASHIITKLEVDKQGRGTMEATILPTSKGKNVIEIIKANGQLGISARGAGSVSPNGTVESDYKLLGIDICTSPSEPTAVFDKSNVFESQNLYEEENEDEELEEAINELERESYLNAVNAGFKGNQKEWLQNCGSLREAMGLPYSKESSGVEKLTEEAVNKRIYSFYQEAVSGGFIGSFDEWKTAFPKLVETASEPVKRIEEKTIEPKGPFKSKATWEEIKLSGFRGTIKEYEEKYPNITIIKPEPPQKPISENETLEEQTKRVFETLKADNPESSITLEEVRRVLKDEYESKREKKTRELAISRVNISLAGSGGSLSQAQLEKMVEEEIGFIKEKRAEKKRKNWQAYRRLLSD